MLIGIEDKIGYGSHLVSNYYRLNIFHTFNSFKPHSNPEM